jgi:hypothetical protein
LAKVTQIYYGEVGRSPVMLLASLANFHFITRCHVLRQRRKSCAVVSSYASVTQVTSQSRIKWNKREFVNNGIVSILFEEYYYPA